MMYDNDLYYILSSSPCKMSFTLMVFEDKSLFLESQSIGFGLSL